MVNGTDQGFVRYQRGLALPETSVSILPIKLFELLFRIPEKVKPITLNSCQVIVTVVPLTVYVPKVITSLAVSAIACAAEVSANDVVVYILNVPSLLNRTLLFQ